MIEAFKRWLKRQVRLAAIAAIAAPRLATAAVILQAGPVTTDGSGRAQVNLYLIDTAASASPIATDGGLAGAALQVTRVSGDAVIGDLQLNPLFDDPFSVTNVTADFASISGSTAIGSPGVDFDADSDRVLIGTLSVTPGLQLSEFDIEPLSEASGYFTTATSNISVDADGVSPGRLTIEVPEPASLALIAAGLLLMLRRCRSITLGCNV